MIPGVHDASEVESMGQKVLKTALNCNFTLGKIQFYKSMLLFFTFLFRLITK